ncbi:prolipoprotein diacylglyceryl transferase [Mucilaginibacter sp. SMC90]|uniref:prolipoprotein diacylglyceryl transferase n=1 Tax=Mucilaginibacter sp. SMC90 TaxID=2929803 RepID=UPI001FB2507D|nr:prolipoprotein diacylglyceryl transferase family protein [Mucilaginibacter sp. SMC90]UOE52308.1 prolipoprotein diacylglyceryl transferase [Mucilaginibacter sp. SMC90]
MFPTIGDLIFYLFHIRIGFPIQTLGFFMALAFLFAYIVFTSEFKRYEANGKINAFKRKVIIGKPASAAEMIVNFLPGFLLGFKLFGAIFNSRLFSANPRAYILSFQGNLTAGVLIGGAFAFWIYRDKKKFTLAKPETTEYTVHPYQLMGLIVFSVGFFGFIGAKLFDVAEHFERLRYDFLGAIFSANGFAYYGGLIFGALTYLYIGFRHKMKLIHLADIGSPGMMLAYGVGRIGCQMAGDGDWGKVNMHLKPGIMGWLPDWMWAFNYPHNAINSGTLIPGCIGNYCNELANPVYPTPFYEAALCIGMFLLMWVFRKRILTAGFMFFLYLVLNGAERFLIEQIRVNPVYHFWGLPFTQAGLIGLLMLLGGLTGFVMLFVKHRALHHKHLPVL